jgi:tetratricopeptide (TPR) repeat protein
VSSFVEEQGNKMNYTIAVDDDSTMSDTWMRPAGRNSIPSAFIVGKTGKIEWIGHPGQMDLALGQIVAGNYDMATFAAEETKARAWTTDSRRASIALRSATRSNDASKVMTILNDLTQKHGNNPQAQTMKYRAMLQFAPSQGSVFAYGSAIAKKNWDDAQFLNSISWWTVDDPTAKYRNYQQATEWAARADELTHHKDAQIIDTYARCLWEQGHIDKAIALQRKAVDLADPQMKSTIEKTLKDYLAEASQG